LSWRSQLKTPHLPFFIEMLQKMSMDHSNYKKLLAEDLNLEPGG
jgi:hypothetical protein